MIRLHAVQRGVSLVSLLLLAVGCDGTDGDAVGPFDPASAQDRESGGAEQAVQALATNEAWIGAVPSGDPLTTPCAQGWVGIRMDDEDADNADSLTFYNQWGGSQNMSGHNFSAGGLIHSASPARAGGNTWVRYCPQKMATLWPLLYDYAVISASNVCPAGSYRFSRRFDNEDGKNHNTFEGDISPNTSSGGLGATVLNFCFVPKDPYGGGGTWDSSLDGQIIFAFGDSGLDGGLQTSGTFGTDDEDDSNNNQFSSSSSTYTSRMRAIISGGRDTVFHWATDSDLVTIDLGTRSTCDLAYLQQQQMRQIVCNYGRSGGPCHLPGWDTASKAYDNANKWFCMY